jgi:hypothetical protein
VIVKKLQVGVGLPTKKIPLINKIPIVKDLGASVSDTFFGFDGLGGTSDSLLLDFSVDLGVDYGGFIMQGKAKPVEPNPGNWQDGVEYYDENGLKIGQGNDSVMVFFETGKSAVVGKQETDVRHWSNNWAQNFKLLKSM